MFYKILPALVILICFSLNPVAGQDDFKNLTWGMPSDEVFKIIRRDRLQKITSIDDNIISVTSTLSNCKGWWYYCFINDRLFKITGALHQPSFMNCDAKLWQKYNYTHVFFATLDGRGFTNRTKSAIYDKKRIDIGEQNPLISEVVRFSRTVKYASFDSNLSNSSAQIVPG